MNIPYFFSGILLGFFFGAFWGIIGAQLSKRALFACFLLILAHFCYAIRLRVPDRPPKKKHLLRGVFSLHWAGTRTRKRVRASRRRRPPRGPLGYRRYPDRPPAKKTYLGTSFLLYCAGTRTRERVRARKKYIQRIPAPPIFTKRHLFVVLSTP